MRPSRPVITPALAEQRLRQIFPRAAFDPTLSAPLAAMAVSALLYIDAVCSDTQPVTTVTWARPTTVIWMSDAALAHPDHQDRLAWRTAAAKGRAQVEALLDQWGEPFQPRYRENSRETLRDETFKHWHQHGAMRKRTDVVTSSSSPRWALRDDFADLFDPSLTDDQAQELAERWRETHLDPGTRLRVVHAQRAEQSSTAVHVTLPDGTRRSLEPGTSSLILKGVIESWAAARLTTPVVLTVSEPGDKVHIGDEKILQQLGIQIDVANVLPDALIADIGSDPVRFWLGEAVASDGPVTEERRKLLLHWASQQNILPSSCSFLTAFHSRNAAAARRRLKDLASGTWAWFADEPTQELAWYEINPSS
ncbi:BsuBI/PstI family type II restriction endonuclease [Hoyosella subflava]|uniref:BsuBIPstI restriction endonuclease domain protein n=1 Tax=Hoyosella subflava (strain DSM 45089 / JCM 17490 / NBRC 109087 / DQS3-9A1) TaxID=443218 RepID=F6EL71_HOYSD|nr:BsuBI/PstI family type II restriction endonuclease [Hoyosella subflava]AEF42734.1 BsuBIPstI restriction endonuclease domain protein [Hoyosella subflava DQS3-9A1]